MVGGELADDISMNIKKGLVLAAVATLAACSSQSGAMLPRTDAKVSVAAVATPGGFSFSQQATAQVYALNFISQPYAKYLPGVPVVTRISFDSPKATGTITLIGADYVPLAPPIRIVGGSFAPLHILPYSYGFGAYAGVWAFYTPQDRKDKAQTTVITLTMSAE